MCECHPEPRRADLEGAGKNTFNTAFVAQILNQRILLTVVEQELANMKVTGQQTRTCRLATWR